MGCISPGGTDLMTGAVGALGFASGSTVLEFGCGEADTLARLAAGHGFRCIGIDKSKALIDSGRKNHPELDLRVGDADLLDALQPERFDAIVFECVLSAIDDGFRVGARNDKGGGQSSAMILRRASRLLKQSGYMLVADLCTRSERPEQLIKSAESAGLGLVSYEDRTKDLDAFAAEKIFEHGSLEAYYKTTVPSGENPHDFFPAQNTVIPSAQNTVIPAQAGIHPRPKPPGYFLATFRKSEPPLSAP